MENGLVRSQEEVNTILQYAKLEKSELLPGVQCLNFLEQMDNDHVKLLEIEPDMMNDLKTGGRLMIRGNLQDSAVLCTTNKTYELKTSETSNTLLLVPKLQLPTQQPTHSNTAVHITGVAHSYLEVRPCRPILSNVAPLLEATAYEGDLEDERNVSKKYTFDELLGIVQSSEHELREHLQKLHTFTLNGHVRLMKFDYLGQVLSHVTGLMDEEDWSMDAVPLETCSRTLAELYPSFVVEHVLSYVGEKINSEDEVLFKLSTERVCRLFGEMVLRPAGQCNLSDFEKAWRACVPAGCDVQFSYLQGLCIIDRESSPDSICYFPASELPEKVAPRFEALFNKKAQWTLDEITPYIEDLCTGKTTIGGLLTKYSRTATLSGTKLFSSRMS